MFVAATYRLPKAQCGSMTQWCLGAFGHCHISFPLSNAILFILQLQSFFIVRGRIQSCSFSSISHPDLPVAMHTFKEVSKEGNPQFRNTIESFIKHLLSGHLHKFQSNSKIKFQNSNPCPEPIYLPFSLEKSATLERWQRWREKVHRTWLRGDTNSRLAQFTTYAVIKSCTCTFYALSLGRGISSQPIMG